MAAFATADTEVAIVAGNQDWERIYTQVPLNSVPHHFAQMQESPFIMRYLDEVLRLCPVEKK